MKRVPSMLAGFDPSRPVEPDPKLAKPHVRLRRRGPKPKKDQEKRP